MRVCKQLFLPRHLPNPSARAAGLETTMDTVIDMPATMSTARPVSHGLRESLAWNLHLAMRDGLDEQIRTSTGTNRDTRAELGRAYEFYQSQMESLR